MADNTVASVQVAKLAKDLAASSGQPFQKVAEGLVTSAVSQVLAYAQAYAPRRTGRLLNSFKSESNGLSGSVWNTAPYAAYDELGTGTRGEFPGRPIVITPKKAKYLRFVAKDGRVVYTKRVVNPGMAPRPFLRPAVERIALPFASKLGDAAVATIVMGPNAPETLNNAPATGWH